MIFFQAAKDVNTWETFFEQPENICLEDIDYSSMQVKLCHVGGDIQPVSIMHCQDETVVNYWRNIARTRIRFREEIKLELEKLREVLLGDYRVLGVFIREGYQKLNDINPKKIVGHPIQAKTEDIIEYAKKYMKMNMGI